MNEQNTQPEGGEALSETELAYFQSEGAAEVTQEAPAPQTQDGEPPSEPTEPQGQNERDEKGRFVPHGALHAEREEHKKTKAQLEEIARKQAVLEDRWNTLLSAGKQEQAQQVEDDPAPDPNQDIFAYVAWQGRQMEKLQTKLSQEDQQRQQMTQQQQEEREIVGLWQNSVQQFTTQQQDFPDAANYLAGLRSQQLAALGLDPATVNATIDAELKGVIRQAKQIGQSPAQVIYEYAKVSGYKPAQADPGTVQMPEALAKVAQAQEASKTLASGGGKAGADPLTPESIASMSDKEFEVWMASPENARRFERMMGG